MPGHPALNNLSPTAESHLISGIVSRPPGELAKEKDTLWPLMERIKGSDDDALRDLYELTAGPLFALARRILRNGADADEVISDVYAQAWQMASQFDPNRAQVIAWLMMICRTRAIDRYRRLQGRSRNDSLAARSHIQPYELDSPDEVVDELQQRAAVNEAVRQLAPLSQHLLTLAFFHGLTHREIAAQTNMAMGTVKSHLRRALLTLREHLLATTDLSHTYA